MILVDVYQLPDGASLCYQLLSERPPENFISHKKMPTISEHRAFMEGKPFRLWLAILTNDIMQMGCPLIRVGAIEVRHTNEFGIAILKEHQGHGYGTKALIHFMNLYPPLPAIPAVRNGHWLANVAPGNAKGKAFFQKLGFKTIQETMQCPNLSS